MNPINKSDNYQYKTNDILGKGTFGEVYKALDIRSGEYVALKIIRNFDKPLLQDPEYLFFKELLKQTAVERNVDLNSVTKPICHPNIVCYYDIFEENNMIYVVMELINGTDLQKWLKNKLNEFIPITTIVDIMKQITEGLMYLDSINVIHRDIKLENVMITTTGTIKLVDYGLSCFKNISRSCNNQVGSYGYTGPEILTDFDKYKNNDLVLQKLFMASDIFAFGVTMFAIANRSLPFNDPIVEKTIENVKTLNVKSNYQGSASDIYSSEWLNNLINCMLEKDYTKRITLKQINHKLNRSKYYYYNNQMFQMSEWIEALKNFGYSIDDNISPEELDKYTKTQLFCQIEGKRFNLQELEYLSKLLGVKYNKINPAKSCMELRNLYINKKDHFRGEIRTKMPDVIKNYPVNTIQTTLMYLHKLDPSFVDKNQLESIIKDMKIKNSRILEDRNNQLETMIRQYKNETDRIIQDSANKINFLSDFIKTN